MDGLKLQPANPTLLQARDAILLADRLLTGGAYQGTIWKVFARRGMGLSAQTPGGSNSTNVIEAFDYPIIGQIPFQRSAMPGSLVSFVQGQTEPLAGVNDEVTLDFFAEEGSRVSFTLTPETASAQLTVKFLKQDGTRVFGPFTAPAGQPVRITSKLLPNTGAFRIEITTTQATAVGFTAARNAALEEHASDTTPSNELNINNSRINPGVTRLAVVGHSNAVEAVFSDFIDATRFVDISGNGIPLDLFDDAEASITTTVGNSLLPAGNVTIGNNGAVLTGSALQVPFVNQPLSAFGSPGLYPFWDDFDDDFGNVYWSEQQIEGTNALIVQWDKRPAYPNTGRGTVQLQVFEDGPVPVRFVYKDVHFESGSEHNKGGSATIGLIKPGGGVAEYSFNTTSVVNGTVLDITTDKDVDEFEFTATAGQEIDVLLDGVGGVDMSASLLRIYDTNGSTLLAVGTTKPLSGGTTVDNFDVGAIGVAIPTTGTYTARVVGKSSGHYVLVATRGAGVDIENSTGGQAPRRTLEIGDDLLGFLSKPGDPVDQLLMPLVAGQKVRLRVMTPYDHPQILPTNTLQPLVQLRRPDGSIARADSNSGPGGIPQIVFTIPSSGTWRIDVRATSGSGEYILKTHLLSASLLASDRDALFANVLVPANTANVESRSVASPVRTATTSYFVSAQTPLTVQQAAVSLLRDDPEFADAFAESTGLAVAPLGVTHLERSPLGVTLRPARTGSEGSTSELLPPGPYVAFPDQSRMAIDTVFADPLELMSVGLEF